MDQIRENAVILKNGELRQIILVGGLNFALKSEAEQSVLIQTYQNFLNSLNFPLQIVIHSRKINIENYLQTLEERRGQEPSVLLQDQISEYQEFIRGFVANNDIMAKVFLVIVPFSPLTLPSKEGILDLLPFRKKPDAAAEKAKKQAAQETDFHENLQQLTQRVNQVLEELTVIGLAPRLLNDEELTELLYNFYNPETTEKKAVAPQKI